MDYERIQKPSSQTAATAFSPRKLRSMLLGTDKNKYKDEEESDPGGGSADEFKDVNIVSSTYVKNPNGNVGISRGRSLEEEALGFEFHKGRSLMPGFPKPAPSKWDDAQKWIANPNSSKGNKGMRKSGRGNGSARGVMEDVEDNVEGKRIDMSEIKREIGGDKGGDWEGENCHMEVDSCGVKNAVIVENKVSQSSAVNLSRHDSSATAQSSTTFMNPPSTVRSVSMRDMGTEMTPIASQEPSRTGTPIRASTPILSPSSSQPTTPRRAASSSIHYESVNIHVAKERELSDKELQMKTRREIMMLGTQLGKTNIAAWASKEDEEKNLPAFQTALANQKGKDVIEGHAAAWEEAEKAKYLARFKEEEIKIQAWENHQIAKSEAEMKKAEVEVERMKANAHDKLMKKLEALRHKAEEKRSAAEARRNQQASRTAQQVDHIRKTGRIPSSCFCWSCCF